MKIFAAHKKNDSLSEDNTGLAMSQTMQATSHSKNIESESPIVPKFDLFNILIQIRHGALELDEAIDRLREIDSRIALESNHIRQRGIVDILMILLKIKLNVRMQQISLGLSNSEVNLAIASELDYQITHYYFLSDGGSKYLETPPIAAQLISELVYNSKSIEEIIYFLKIDVDLNRLSTKDTREKLIELLEGQPLSFANSDSLDLRFELALQICNQFAPDFFRDDFEARFDHMNELIKLGYHTFPRYLFDLILFNIQSGLMSKESGVMLLRLTKHSLKKLFQTTPTEGYEQELDYKFFGGIYISEELLNSMENSLETGIEKLSKLELTTI